jgi:uncharacterized membrane protein YdbT with pleckstrin-like domain
MTTFLDSFLFRKHLEDGEHLLFAGHKHWIEIFWPVSQLAFFGSVFPWGLYLITGAPLFFIGAIVFSIIAYTIILYEITDWYFDALLVTSQSLLLVEWHGFFHKDSTRISYDSVESIALEQKGVLSTIFGFGTVSVERKAAPPLVLKTVTSPKEVEGKIIEGQTSYNERNTSENTEALQGILSELVAQHIKKHGWKKR